MRSPHDPRHTLARLGRGLGLVTLLFVSQACPEAESDSPCLYDKAHEVVEQASAEANQMRCATDDDCIFPTKLPSCYPGCGVVLPEAALTSFEERVAKFSCDRHDPVQCAGRAIPECAAVRPICVAGRCEASAEAAGGEDASARDAGALDAAVPDSTSDNGCPHGCTHKLGDFCAQWELSPREDYETTLAAWTQECGGFNAAFVLEAQCSNGQRLLYRGSGLSIERRYFDGAGELLSLEVASDGNPPGCPLFWPVASSCGNAQVTRMSCGNAYDVGQRIQL